MTQFKVGDRVRFKEHPDAYEPFYGSTGTVTGPGGRSEATAVDWDNERSRPVGPDITLNKFLELVTRKDTPKVGDTVRVVLEAKVADVTGGTVWLVACNSDEFRHDVNTSCAHVKSIEIITPAKPSVTSLPCCSVVVSDDGLVLVKREASWNGTDGMNYSDADVDRMGWAELVAKVDE